MAKQQAAAEKTEDATEFPAGKKQADMGEIMRVLKPITQANPERFLRQESAYNVFCYWAQAGSTIEDHLAPEFWLALSSKFSPNDELVVKEETGEWRAHFLIRSIGSDGVDIVLLDENQIGGTAPVGAKIPYKSGPRVIYRGAHLRWSVFDGDKELIGGLAKETDAEQWRQNNNVPGAMA